MGFPNWTSRLGPPSVSDSDARRHCKESLALLSGAALTVSETPNVPSPWIVAATVLGLPTALWAYKCLMMVLFQRKIIYMGGIPLGSRTEELYNQDPSLHVREINIHSKNHVSLSGIVVSRSVRKSALPLVVMYLQGNAGNPLHRIPIFRLMVRLLDDQSDVDIVVVAVAPRSFWKSTNKAPSESGWISDYAATLDWIRSSYPHSPILLYGHSIGGSVAVKLLDSVAACDIKGLVIENAFTSVLDMVRTLYPSRWLPYYYLGPLVWDKWDALATLRQPDSAHTPESSALHRVVRSPASILVFNSSRDELVPPEMSEKLLEAASAMCSPLSECLPERVSIEAALHDDAFTKRQWREAMRAYLRKVIRCRSI